MKALGRIPMRTDIAQMCDRGAVEDIDAAQWLGGAFDALSALAKK